MVPEDHENPAWLGKAAEDLGYIARVIVLRSGSAGLSRHTSKALFLKYFREHLSQQIVRQLQQVRSMTGLKLAFDHTYGSVSTLTAPTSDALTAHSRRKLMGFNASLLTVTAEHGLVVASVIVPNDSQPYVKAVLLGLYGAPLPTDMQGRCAYSEVHQAAAVGGPLAKHPMLICTDASRKDKHLWQSVAKPIAEACLQRCTPIFVPSDGVPHSLLVPPPPFFGFGLPVLVLSSSF